jgi:hypothetical protein
MSRICLAGQHGWSAIGDESPDLLESCPPRPRGMRRQTYQRLVAVDEALEEGRIALILGRF